MDLNVKSTIKHNNDVLSALCAGSATYKLHINAANPVKSSHWRVQQKSEQKTPPKE